MSEAFICDAVRTPIGRYGGALSAVRADDLAAAPLKALIDRHPGMDWSAIDDVIYGCANQAGEDNRNVARMAVLLAGLPVSVPTGGSNGGNPFPQPLLVPSGAISAQLSDNVWAGLAVNSPFGLIADYDDGFFGRYDTMRADVFTLNVQPSLAVKLGDRIAILQAGSKIVQYDTPEQILTHPADDFVRTFVGAGAALKQLTLTRIRDVGLHEAAVAHIGDDPAEAVRTARAIEREHVIVLDAQDRPQRWLSLEDLADPRSLEHVSRDEDLECVSLASTLNDALDEMLTSSHGVVVVTGRRNTYQGVVRVETIMDAMSGVRSAANTAGRAP